MNPLRLIRQFLCLALLLNAVTAMGGAVTAAAGYRVIDLGTLGGSESSGFAIDSAGDVVGDSDLPGNTSGAAFLYTSGSMQNLGTLGSGTIGGAAGTAINNAGQIAGYIYLSGTGHAFLYQSGTMQDLGTLPGFPNAQAEAINAAGQIAGYCIDSSFSTYEAFLYESGSMTDIGHFPLGTYSQAYGINNAGVVVGDGDTGDLDGDVNAFVCQSGTMTDLGTLATVSFGHSSYATAINNAGVVTGYSNNNTGAQHAFLYQSGTMTDLGSLGGDSFGYAINNLNQVAGYADLSGSTVAILYSGGQMQNLNSLVLPGETGGFNNLEQAQGINDSGDIAGYGTKPGFVTHAFLAVPAFAPVLSIQLVAAEGDVVGSSTTHLTSAGSPAIDAAGDVAFRGKLLSKSGNKSATHYAVLLYSGTNLTPTVIGETGFLDPLIGGTFETVNDPILSGSGALAFTATLKAGENGVTPATAGTIWLYQGFLEPAARTGIAFPDGDSFTGFKQIAIDDNGDIATEAKLSGPGLSGPDALTFCVVGGTSTQVNLHDGGTVGTDLIDKFTVLTPLPFVGGQSRSFDGIAGNVAALFKLADPSSAVGFALSGTSGYTYPPAALEGEPVPGLPGVTVKSFDEPAVNANAVAAFRLTLTGTGVKGTNNAAVATLSGTTITPVARLGGFAPDASGNPTGAIFTKLSDPVLNNSNGIAFVATLKTGTAGVLPANKTGIWSDASGSLEQVVRIGDSAPGASGGVFSKFTQIVLPDTGDVVFLAGFSGGAHKKGTGIWIAPAGGGALSAVAVTGGTLTEHAATKTISKLAIFVQPPTSLGQSRSFDASTGNLVFQVTFTDKTWAIYSARFLMGI